METNIIIGEIKETFNISNSKIIVNRSNLSKNNFISRSKNTSHINDVFYMLYGLILGPGNHIEAKIFYTEMVKNQTFIVEAFNKMQIIGFNNIRNVTLGHWYINVNCINDYKNFSMGKIVNSIDSSKTLPGDKLAYFFSKLI